MSRPHLELANHREWLKRILLRIRGALLVISHDRRFLEPRQQAERIWLRPGTSCGLNRGLGIS